MSPAGQITAMSTTHLQPVTLKPLSREVIAFACSIVHSKPPGISVGEYIRLLRLHVAKGKRRDAISSIHSHLDRTSYWRSECERVKIIVKAKEDESIGLRLEIDALTAKLEASKAPAILVKKRKKADADVIPYPRSPKRVKHDTPMGISTILKLDESTESALGEGGDIGNTLLRTLYHLHATIKSHAKVDPPALLYHIIDATSHLTDTVNQDVRQFIDGGSQDVNELKSTLTLCRRAIASILVAYGRLEASAEDGNTQGQAIYALVHVYRDLLATFSYLANWETRRAIATDSSVQKTSAKSKPKPPRLFNIKETPTLSIFINFLESIIDQLDPRRHAHKALFEGITFCILSRLGDRLHHTVFGHIRAPTLEAEIMLSNAVDEIEDDGPSPPLPPHDDEQKQIRLEAPYLIHLLNHIMKAAPSHLGAILSARASKAKQTTGNVPKRGTLTVGAKDCLQRTLVNCIFGTEGVGEDDPLAYCLKMPVKPITSVTMPRIKEPEVQDWFKGEMWRLLGWDILSKEGEW